jgi:hypothetical protein
MSKSFGVSNGVNVIQKSNKNKDVQRMNFGPNDCPEEQQNTRYDKINSTIQKRRVFTKKELQQKLNEKNINAKGTLAALQATCQNHGIPIEEVNCKGVGRKTKGDVTSPVGTWVHQHSTRRKKSIQYLLIKTNLVTDALTQALQS